MRSSEQSLLYPVRCCTCLRGSRMTSRVWNIYIENSWSRKNFDVLRVFLSRLPSNCVCSTDYERSSIFPFEPWFLIFEEVLEDTVPLLESFLSLFSLSTSTSTWASYRMAWFTSVSDWDHNITPKMTITSMYFPRSHTGFIFTRELCRTAVLI